MTVRTLSSEKCRFRKGQNVSFCYEAGAFKVMAKRVPLGCFPRYDISNGTKTLTNVREKDLDACARPTAN